MSSASGRARGGLRGSGGGDSPAASDDGEERRLRHSGVGRRRGRRRLTNRNDLRTPRPNSPTPPPRRHDGAAGSSRAAALAPPLPAPSTEPSDDESYSSVDSVSTDDGDELVKIVDPVELEARVLAKSMRSVRGAEKRRRVDAEYEEVMNEVRLE